MTEPTFWDRMRENVSRGIRAAADRTDELARLGKLKLDLVNLKRKLVYELGELGKQLLTHIDGAANKDDLGTVKGFTEQKKVKEILDRIDLYRTDIADTEKGIKDLTNAPQAKPASGEETKDKTSTADPAQ
jgi:hypothetical protein